MLKIAIAGIGRWGKILLEEFNQTSAVIACCHTGSVKNRKWLVDNYPKIKIFQDLDTLLGSNNLDAIIISTPIKSHFSIAKQALIYNTNVFVEKPPSTSQVEYRELLNLAHKTRLVLFADNIFLYHPLYSIFRNLVKKNGIERARFNWHKIGSFTESISWNLAYHEMYLAIDLFGDVRSIKHKKEEQLKTDNIVKFQIEFTSGVNAQFTINRQSSQKYKSIEVEGRGKRYKWINDTILEQKNSSRYKLIHKSSEKALKYAVAEFLLRLKTKKNNKEEEFLTEKAIGTIQKLESISA